MNKKSLIFIITIIYCNLSYGEYQQGNYPQSPQGQYSQSFTWSPAKESAKKECEDRLAVLKKEQAEQYIYRNTFLTFTVAGVIGIVGGLLTENNRIALGGFVTALFFGGIGEYSKSKEAARIKETNDLIQTLARLDQ